MSRWFYLLITAASFLAGSARADQPVPAPQPPKPTIDDPRGRFDVCVPKWKIPLSEMPSLNSNGVIFIWECDDILEKNETIRCYVVVGVGAPVMQCPSNMEINTPMDGQ